VAETLKFGAVEMRLGDDLKPRICELLCYCKLNKKEKVIKLVFQGSLITAEKAVIISGVHPSSNSRDRSVTTATRLLYGRSRI
jgi:hypothetical protein